MNNGLENTVVDRDYDRKVQSTLDKQAAFEQRINEISKCSLVEIFNEAINTLDTNGQIEGIAYSIFYGGIEDKNLAANKLKIAMQNEIEKQAMKEIGQ